MAEMVIHWDGKRVPKELRDLAPGRYALVPIDELELTPEEDAAVTEGLQDLDAGNTVPFEQVVREFEARFRQP